MIKLHKSLISEKNFEPKEGQRELLCSNKDSLPCPSLDYKYITSSGNEVDRAFDVLFEEVYRVINLKK